MQRAPIYLAQNTLLPCWLTLSYDTSIVRFMLTDYRPLMITFGTPSIEAATELVVGRDRTSEQLWKSIAAGSVRLLSERRMGKTWLLRLAIATKPDWAAPVLLDAEGYGSAPEFVQDLNAQLHSHSLIDDTWYQKTSDWF